MASSVCIIEDSPIYPASSVLFLGTPKLTSFCAREAIRIGFASSVRTAKFSDLTEDLMSPRADIVIGLSDRMWCDDLDHVADRLIAGWNAYFVPIASSVDHLMVGPLYGAGRSCFSCWKMRRHNATQFTASDGVFYKAIVSDDPLWSVDRMLLALALARYLLCRRTPMFTSPYILYHAVNGQWSDGLLIGCQECARCLANLRALRPENGEIRQTLSRIRPSIAQGDQHDN
jgi:hypothetical protein